MRMVSARRSLPGDRAPHAHWLFRPGDGDPSCVCILEYEDGDYWVIDSPTGTYASGHADRGKWRIEEERYLAQGYIREAQAKANGLIPSSWSRATPDPEAEWQRRFRRRRVAALLVLIVVLVVAWMFVSR
jgi:hypothetical protein